MGEMKPFDMWDKDNKPHPLVYLFIDGKLLRWNREDEFTLDNFLDFLSSDNYKKQSTVVSDKLSKWIWGKL